MITLDILRLLNPGEAHAYLKEQFSFPAWYGANLDALYDCLTDLGPTEVVLLHADQGNDYAARVLRVLSDAARANLQLRICPETPKAPQDLEEEDTTTWE